MLAHLRLSMAVSQGRWEVWRLIKSNLHKRQNACVLRATGDLPEIPRNLYSVAFRQFEMVSALHVRCRETGLANPVLRPKNIGLLTLTWRKTAIPAELRGSASVCSNERKQNGKIHSAFFGAPVEIRTPDPLIKSQVLYRLSYRGKLTSKSAPNYNTIDKSICQ